MSTIKHSNLFFIFIILLMCYSLIGCNENDSDSDKTKSIDTEKAWYNDADEDGYGDESVNLVQSAQPDGYVGNSDDCADYDINIFPGAVELCDGKDNNCNGVVDENGCQPDGQKIKGRITNLNNAEIYITKDSNLQLVMIPSDGQLVFTTDAQGRLIYTSDLAVIDMPTPSDDYFLFETYGLLPGQYVIAAQYLEPYAQGSLEIPILETTENQPAMITIPEGGVSPFEVDLANLSIPVPTAVMDLMAIDTVPDMPNGVSATDGDFEDKIRVTWNASSGATSYDILRADSFNGTKVKIASTPSAMFDDTNLPCGEENFYYYWVAAKNAAGSSALFYNDMGFIRCPIVLEVVKTVDNGNAVAEPADPADTPVILATPTGTAASDGKYPDKITITWNAVPSATSYDIYRTREDCCGTKIRIGSSNNTTHDDFDVVIGDYFYWIKANNVDGTSEFSLRPDGGHIMTRPFNPTGVNASDGTYLNKVQIIWDKAPTASFSYNNSCCPPLSDKKPIVSSYEIYRATWSDAPKILIGTTSTNQFFDTDLPCSECCRETYVYWVKAINAAGTSSFSEDDIGYVYQTLCDPYVTASDGRANCVWITWNTDTGGICSPNSATGAKKFAIYRSDSADGEKIVICTIDNDGCNRYLDSTTTCPKVYYYWIKAIDGRGYTSCTFGNFDTGYCESE